MKDAANKINNILYEMANLRKSSTGIDSVIWVSEKGNAKHGPRIKMSSTNKALNLDITISISDNPTLINGRLDRKIFNKVSKWIVINKNVLLKYWNNEIYTDELIYNIKGV